MKTSVILPGGWLKKIRHYLLDGSENEFCCYLFCGVTRSRSRLKLLGRSYAFPDKQEDYQISHGVSCRPTQWFLDNVLYERPKENDLIRNNLSIVDIHSHPFAKGEHIAFSSMDDEWQRHSVEYFYRIRRYTGYHCFIVLGENVFDGRVYRWDSKNGKPVQYDLNELIMLDYPYRKWQSISCKQKKRLSKAQKVVCDRQIRAFGKEGQTLISELTAGIIGVGGIGSIAAEGLTRLGIRKFVLVDQDHAEESNLNRYLGMTRADALSGLQKTAITTREILNIAPDARIKSVNQQVEHPKAQKALSRECDFLVLGTDNILSRAFTNELALQYNIPLFSAGSIVNASPATGKVHDIAGEYFFVLPGKHTGCLNCSGLIDYHQVSYLLSTAEVQQEGEKRGYVQGEDIIQPAVRPLNGVITEMMLSQIHDYFCGFKEKLVESLEYDQKNNVLQQRTWLHPELDINIDNVFLEARQTQKGTVEVLINGERIIVIKIHDRDKILDLDLSENIRNTLHQFMEKLEEAYQQKKRCPYCGNGGKTGLGNNEPLTRYPYNHE